MTSPTDHAATVRLADRLTDAFDARDSILHAEHLAEIVALADRATELEARVDAWVHEAVTNKERARAAEARATELERAAEEALEENAEYADRIMALHERAERAETALRAYDAVLETAISELNAQARRRYADTMPGQLDTLVGDFIEAAKTTRAKHRRARAALGETAPPGPRYGCAPGCRADMDAGLHKPECRVPPEGSA